VCTAPITYRGVAQLQIDIDNLKAALKGAKPQEAFMPAISPTSAADWQRNAYYKTEEEYLFAIADALLEEYERSSRPAFCCRSTIRISSPTGSRSPISRSSSFGNGRSCASRRSTMRCATFRRKK